MAVNQKAVKVLNRILDAGFTEEKTIAAMTMDDILSIMERTIKRGDIYYAKLNPVVGSEQGGKHRPVLIISNDKGNKHSTTVIVAAITGMEHAKAKLPTHIIAKGYECLEKDSIILLEQIRTLDKQRLQEYIGTFDRRLMSLVDDALAISIGISKKD